MTYPELVAFAGFNSNRTDLLTKGLVPFAEELERFKVDELYIDGSFTTDKSSPNDIDCFVKANFGEHLHVFLVNGHDRLKTQYHVDIYPAIQDVSVPSGSVAYWSEFFGHTRDVPPKAKGLVALKLPL